MTHDRWLCGWRVASEIPLPDLLPWQGERDHTVDIEVRIGRVPSALNDPVHQGPFLQIGPDGACRFEIESVAAYLVRNGREIVVEPWLDPAAPDIRVFLLGTVFGILCHQRGLLPLHASCIMIDGRAVALAAASGVGKSTLAAACVAAGHALVADDVTVVDLGAASGPLVLPSFPRLKLWRDAMSSLGLSVHGLERSRPSLEKFHVPVEGGFHTAPAPLAQIHHLELAGDVRHEGVRPLRGIAAVDALLAAVYRTTCAVAGAGPVGLVERAVRCSGAVASYRVGCRREHAALQETVAAIAAAARAQIKA